MKTITMELSEYEEMLAVMKQQQEVISQLKDQSNVILVDNRYNVNTHIEAWPNIEIPVITVGEDNIVSNLKGEFDSLERKLKNVLAKIGNTNSRNSLGYIKF